MGFILSRASCILSILCFGVLTAFPANADIWFTKSGASGDGISWASAGSLQATVDAAEFGDEVWVAAGRYTSLSDPVLIMKAGVSLYGGFAGNETSLLERSIESNPTVIDGERMRCCIYGANDTRLDGFTVTQGLNLQNGGGLCVVDSDMAIINCRFTDSRSRGIGGGGIYADKSTLLLEHCSILGNNALAGGGMFTVQSVMTVRKSFFSKNRAYPGYGGGVLINSPTSANVFVNCVFTMNSAKNSGGGICQPYSTREYSEPTQLINCTFTRNVAHWASATSGLVAPYNSILCANPSRFDDMSGYRGTYYSLCDVNAYERTDPRWVNPPYSLYLRPDSPCIDAANPALAPATDYAGNARPSGAGCDQGAYEGAFSGNSIVQLNLTITPQGYGETDPPAHNHPFVRNERIHITATPQSGYAFSHWEGSVYGTERGITITMDSNRSVTAVFEPRVVRVSASSTSPTPDGASWETAYPSIQAALDSPATQNGGEIWVTSGVYTGTGNRPVVSMRESVYVYGGFAGTETDCIQRSPETNTTTIDGEYVRTCIVGANNTVLDGFTITHGDNGMFNSGASPIIKNCTFVENRSLELDARLTGTGAAIFNDAASPQITNCRFLRNTCAVGGAIYNLESISYVSGCIFDGNSADGPGGAIYNDHSTASFSLCTFEGNASGGAWVGYGGGAICNSDSTLQLDNCVMVSNHAVFMGGALDLESGTARISNSNLVGNTLAGSDDAKGGAMSVRIATARMQNCIVWGNSAPMDPAISMIPASVVEATHNCIEFGYAGEWNMDADPRLINIQTDQRLKPESPCINTGDNTRIPRTDFGGLERPQYDTVDIGAYEYPEGYGFLTVNILPVEMIAKGAQWRLLGEETWRASGDTIAYLPSRWTRIEYKPVLRWDEPMVQPVQIPDRETLTVVGEYLPSPFRISRHPIGGWQSFGSRAILVVETRGAIGEVSYQWKFNGDVISGATSSVWESPPLTLESSGEYLCEASDDEGTVVSNPAKIEVVDDAVPLYPFPLLMIVGLICLIQMTRVAAVGRKHENANHE